MSSYQNCRIFLEASTNLSAVVCLSLTLFNDHLTAVDIGLIGDGVSTLNTSNYTHARLSSLVRPFIKNERERWYRNEMNDDWLFSNYPPRPVFASIPTIFSHFVRFWLDLMTGILMHNIWSYNTLIRNVLFDFSSQSFACASRYMCRTFAADDEGSSWVNTRVSDLMKSPSLSG